MVVAAVTTTLNALLFLGLAISCRRPQLMRISGRFIMVVSYTAFAAWTGVALLVFAEILRVEKVADDGGSAGAGTSGAAP